MAGEQESERPKAVTVIGWIWVVVAGYLLFRNVFDLILWKALQPAMPMLLRLMEDELPEMPFLRPIFDHLVALKAVQGIACAAIVFVAWALLRLHSWARAAMQVVCGLVVVYAVGYAAVWSLIWPKALAAKVRIDPSFTSRVDPRIVLAALLAYCVLVAAAAIVMVSLLRSARVRAAFQNRSTF